MEDSTQAKIYYFNIATVKLTRLQQDVLRFQISVDDRQFMDIEDTLQQTFHHFCDQFVCQVPSLLIESFKLASIDVLHLDHHEPFILVDSFEADHALVVKRFHYFRLVF